MDNSESRALSLRAAQESLVRSLLVVVVVVVVVLVLVVRLLLRLRLLRSVSTSTPSLWLRVQPEGTAAPKRWINTV